LTHNKPEISSTIELLEVESNSETNKGRKGFVEPELSSPVDVLEATTFFQGTDSGSTI
jgi:hypothetical protein